MEASSGWLGWNGGQMSLNLRKRSQSKKAGPSMLFHYHSGAPMVVSFCLSLSYNICVLQSSLLSWLASSALLSWACAQIAVPTPSTQGPSPQAPTAVSFLVEILCRMSEVSYQLMSFLPLGQEYTPGPEGTEVVGEQIEWERNISLVTL